MVHNQGYQKKHQTNKNKNKNKQKKTPTELLKHAGMLYEGLIWK